MKLWIDDIRPAPNGYDIWAKSYQEAVNAIDTYANQITHISFDHDIASYDDFGNELTGYAVAVYIEQQIYYGDIDANTIIGIQIHSSNSSGSPRIRNCFEQIKKVYNNNLVIIYAPYEQMDVYDSFWCKLIT